MSYARALRLKDLKLRIDAVHETILHALKIHDEAVLDRAMEEQHLLMKEYSALLMEGKDQGPPLAET